MPEIPRAVFAGLDRPSVLVLAPPRFVGPLGVIRTLRGIGVRVYALATRQRSLAAASRYCAGTFDVGHEGRPTGDEELILNQLLRAGRRLGSKTVLIAGSDEWAVFIATHADALSESFIFPRQRLDLIQALASKEAMHALARAHGVATPRIARPASLEDAETLAEEFTYPVMLKPILSRPGRQTVTLATDRRSLLSHLRTHDEPGNVMFQEYIPGTDSDVWIFNGYFDHQSRCLAAFTGRKLRQHPAHMGLCALGECVHNQEVIDITKQFLGAIGYRGIVDIGYRWDRRDRSYKVLDINPRLGGAFRLFVDVNGMDVARACYLDMTGHRVDDVVPREGRRWVLEAADMIALKHYRSDDGLRLRDWIRSFRGVEEGATFSLRDPFPFAVAMATLAVDTLEARWERASRRLRAGARRARKEESRLEERQHAQHSDPVSGGPWSGAGDSRPVHADRLSP